MGDEQGQRIKRSRRLELNRKLRQAFLEGAEERSQHELGRGLTEEELRRILRRYPGDLAEPGEG